MGLSFAKQRENGTNLMSRGKIITSSSSLAGYAKADSPLLRVNSSLRSSLVTDAKEQFYSRGLKETRRKQTSFVEH